VLDNGVRSWRLAGRERRHTRTVLAIAPEVAARAAVIDERRRLAVDIAAGLRESLTAIGGQASMALTATDPAPAIGDIHREARRATADLRRHLGLLRDPLPPTAPGPVHVPAARAPETPDLLIAAAVTALAVVEAVAYPLIERWSRGWLSVALIGLAAAAIVGRRTAPGPAALAVGLTYLAGLAFDAPLSGGFWCLATIGGVLWTIAVRSSSTWRDASCAGFLLLSVSASAWLLDPDNAALLTLIMIVALAGGAPSGSPWRTPTRRAPTPGGTRTRSARPPRRR